MWAEEGRRRIVIENVEPEVDFGRFAIKRIVGERVSVEANVFCDGYDVLSCSLLYRPERGRDWTEVSMEPLGNDRWQAEFKITQATHYLYTLKAWVDRFRTWQRDLVKKVEAGQDVSVDFLVGTGLIEEAEQLSSTADIRRLQESAAILHDGEDLSRKLSLIHDEQLADMVSRYLDQPLATFYGKELKVVVERDKARFSTWYEMFPRSCSPEPGKHGTFRDCEARLPCLASMGFDVLHLPPIHPIGHTNRKGKNNAPVAGPGDVGTPWAIGSEEGGHKAIHPELGTLDDFRRFLAKAKEYGIEIALDLAFNSSPDHPYVEEHPEWFRWRPDGTVQYAENPPKKYQDIYPFYFEGDHWRELWNELKSIIVFWVEQGVRIFRVDNPHTKPFNFWEWLIADVQKDYPDIIFLSEAFTRPKIMYYLAKLGFTQSYTYFAWRNTKWELTQYFTELTQTGVREFFIPNLWPNTPDILTEYLQSGGRPAFMARLVLAATLGTNYGIYGPAFELCVNTPREPGSEEYLNSEKYEIEHWDIEKPNSLKDFIARVNWIRRENPALHSNWSLRFHHVDNDQLICYSKSTENLTNVILVVVNLDYRYTQSGWVDLSLDALGLDYDRPYQVHDLLDDARYHWYGSHNYVELNPHRIPAHIFQIEAEPEGSRA